MADSFSEFLSRDIDFIYPAAFEIDPLDFPSFLAAPIDHSLNDQPSALHFGSYVTGAPLPGIDEHWVEVVGASEHPGSYQSAANNQGGVPEPRQAPDFSGLQSGDSAGVEAGDNQAADVEAQEVVTVSSKKRRYEDPDKKVVHERKRNQKVSCLNDRVATSNEYIDYTKTDLGPRVKEALLADGYDAVAAAAVVGIIRREVEQRLKAQKLDEPFETCHDKDQEPKRRQRKLRPSVITSDEV